MSEFKQFISKTRPPKTRALGDGIDFHKAELAGILEVRSGEIDNIIARLDRFYRIKSEPKRSGGFRTFYVPQGRLRQVQDKILQRVLKYADFPEYLHGG